jgi:hypothetical protein
MGVMFGDGGRLFVWVPCEDLEAAHFDGCTIEMDPG